MSTEFLVHLNCTLPICSNFQNIHSTPLGNMFRWGKQVLNASRNLLKRTARSESQNTNLQVNESQNANSETGRSQNTDLNPSESEEAILHISISDEISNDTTKKNKDLYFEFSLHTTVQELQNFLQPFIQNLCCELYVDGMGCEDVAKFFSRHRDSELRKVVIPSHTLLLHLKPTFKVRTSSGKTVFLRVDLLKYIFEIQKKLNLQNLCTSQINNFAS